MKFKAWWRVSNLNCVAQLRDSSAARTVASVVGTAGCGDGRGVGAGAGVVCAVGPRVCAGYRVVPT